MVHRIVTHRLCVVTINPIVLQGCHEATSIKTAIVSPMSHSAEEKRPWHRDSVLDMHSPECHEVPRLSLIAPVIDGWIVDRNLRQPDHVKVVGLDLKFRFELSNTSTLPPPTSSTVFLIICLHARWECLL